jgi:CheY-like chemotaxis protein
MVLIVVSDPRQADAVCRAIHEANPGLQLEVVASGRTALERLGSAPFDAVLLHHRTADLTGLETLRELMTRHRHAGVVFLVPFAQQAMADEAVRAGAFEAVMDSELLYPSLASALERASQSQRAASVARKEARLDVLRELLEGIEKNTHDPLLAAMTLAESLITDLAPNPEARQSAVQLRDRIAAIRERLRRAQSELTRTERHSALKQLAGAVMHHVNNPLAAASAHAQMLLAMPKPPSDLRDRLQQLYEALKQIEAYTTKLRDVQDVLTPYVGSAQMIDLDAKPPNPSPGEK